MTSFVLGLFTTARVRPVQVSTPRPADGVCSSAANTGSLYGNNPFEQPAEELAEEGEQQPQDTTKKERKIRKPLESYFFSDSVRSLNNFRWNVRRDYNRVEIGPLDTTLTDWRIDYPVAPRSKKYKSGYYTELMIEGTLPEHIVAIDKEASVQVKNIVKSLAKANKVDEILKQSNQFEWIRLMNNFKNSAEEIVLKELIYN